jgi:hypothetical protein
MTKDNNKQQLCETIYIISSGYSAILHFHIFLIPEFVFCSPKAGKKKKTYCSLIATTHNKAAWI